MNLSISGCIAGFGLGFKPLIQRFTSSATVVLFFFAYFFRKSTSVSGKLIVNLVVGIVPPEQAYNRTHLPVIKYYNTIHSFYQPVTLKKSQNRHEKNFPLPPPRHSPPPQRCAVLSPGCPESPLRCAITPFNLVFTSSKSFLNIRGSPIRLLSPSRYPGADLSEKDFSGTSLRYANLDNVDFSGANFSGCDLTKVRIEETTDVQSFAVSANKKIIALYEDGIVREWNQAPSKTWLTTNLDGDIKGKDNKLAALPGSDLTLYRDGHLFFYDRVRKKIQLKATIDIALNIKIIKIGLNYLLLHEESGGKNRLVLVDLRQQEVVKSLPTLPFLHCDHLEDRALVIFNEKEELQVTDISLTSRERSPIILPKGAKVSCLSVNKCRKPEDRYLLGTGLYNGAVQVWQICINDWEHKELVPELILHKDNQPVKNISFYDENHIVSSGLDKTIRVLRFDQEGRPVGAPDELKMKLQCRGMKIKGLIRDKIEGKKLREFIDRAK